MSNTSLFILIITILYASLLNAYTDPLSELRYSSYKGIITWQAIHPATQWVSGVKVNANKNMTLKPYAHTKIRLHRNHYLKITFPTQQDYAYGDQLSITYSNGTGLYIPLVTHQDQQHKSIFIIPSAISERIINITNNAPSHAIKIAVFYSQYHDINRNVPYQNPIALPLDTVDIKNDTTGKTETFSQLYQQAVKLTLTGPIRVKVETRLNYKIYNKYDEGIYHLQSRIDKEAWIDRRFDTFLVTDQRFFINTVKNDQKQHTMIEKQTPDSDSMDLEPKGRSVIARQWLALGAKEQSFIDIPEGKHTLTLKSPQALFIRLFSESKVLLKSLNKKAIQAENNPQNLTQLSQLEHFSQHYLYDIKHKEIALDLAQLYQNKLSTFNPQKSLKAELFFKKNSYYRQLLPNNMLSISEEGDRMYHFLHYALKTVRQQGKHLELISSFVDKYCRQINAARFNLIPNRITEAKRYLLPPRYAKSRLKINVNQTLLTHPLSFYLQYDNDLPILLTVYPDRELPIQAYLATRNEACISQAHQNGNIEKTLPMVSYPLIDNAYLEIDLPAKVKQIKLWNTNTTQQKLYISLQYRSSKKIKIDNDLYLQLIKEQGIKLMTQGFIPYLLNQPITLHINTSHITYLKQHWLEIKRFLWSHKKQFFPDYKKDKQNVTIDNAQLNTLMTTHLLSYFQKRILKGLLLDGQYREQIIKKLLQYYQEQHSNINILRLYIIQAFLTQKSSVYRQLVSTLIQQGYYQLALTLGLLLLDSDQSLRDELVQAAYVNRQWNIFFTLLAGYKEVEKIHYWCGYEAQYRGLLEVAREHWKQAGKKGLATIKRLDKGLSLWQSGGKDKKQNDHAWQQWKQDYKGANSWKKINTLIYNYKSALLLYNPTRDLYQTVFLGNKAKPIQFTITGPATLRLNTRLVHTQQNMDATKQAEQNKKTDWLTIVDNNHLLTTPYLASFPTQGLTLIENKNQEGGTKQPGTLQSFTYQVTAGTHHISVYAEKEALLLSLQQKQPIQDVIFPDRQITDHHLFYKPLLEDKNIAFYWQCWKTGCIRYNKENTAIFLPRVKKIIPTKHVSSLVDKTTPALAKENNQFIFIPDMPFSDFKETLIQACRINAITEPFPDIITIKNMDIYKPKAAIAILNNCPIYPTQKLLQSIVWRYQHYPQERSFLLALVEKMSAYPHQSGQLKQLIQSITSKTSWVLQKSVIQSAGLRSIETPDKTLLPPLKKRALITNNNLSIQEQRGYKSVLKNSNIFGASFYIKDTTSLYLYFDKNTLPYQNIYPASISIEIDNQEKKWISLSEQKKTNNYQVSLLKGLHNIKIQWLNPIAGESVGVNIELKKGDQSLLVNNTKKTYYHIATQQEPIILGVQAPVHIRFDLLDNDTVHSFSFSLFDNEKQIIITPPKGKKEALLRIYQRTISTTKNPPLQGVRKRKNIATIPLSHLAKKNTTPLLPVKWFDYPCQQKIYAHKKKKQIKPVCFLASTFALSLQWKQGVDDEIRISEDSIQKNTNQYLQFGVQHLGYQPYWGKQTLKNWLDSMLLLRLRDTANPVIGIKEVLYIQPDWWGIGLRFDGRMYAQQQLFNTSKQWLWSSDIRFAINKSWQINAKTRYLRMLTFFHKHFDFNDDNIANSIHFNVDPDVWNNYSDIHYKGMILSENIYYNPWIDTQWYSGLRLYSDEDFNLIKPEHLTFKAGWKQLFTPHILAHLQYQWRYYFPQRDNYWNRINAFDRTSIRAKIEWQQWTSIGTQRLSKRKTKYGRLFGYFDMRYTIENNEWNAELGVKWLIDHARGYTDFRPQSISFKHIRERGRYTIEPTP